MLCLGMQKPAKPTLPKSINSPNMGDLKIQFLTDYKGQKVGVLLSMEQYNLLIEQLEELEDIKAFDEYKATNEPTIPFGQAINEIEQQRDDL